MKISLASARVNAGLTQNQASALMKKGITTIWRWENNPSSVTGKNQELCARIYGIPKENIDWEGRNENEGK